MEEQVWREKNVNKNVETLLNASDILEKESI